MSTPSQFIRHGSYYTPINSDCVEFCPHPDRQQYLFTGHYELLSLKQGKLGQMCLSEVLFAPKSVSPEFIPIPEDEYCTATNENQGLYMTREVDLAKLLAKPLGSFGHDLTKNANNNFSSTKTDNAVEKTSETLEPLQNFIQSNISLKIHDQINIPALLDAKWSNQPIPLYTANQVESFFNPVDTVDSDQDVISQLPYGFASLIAAALEDGSVRLFSTTNTSSPQSSPQSSQGPKLQPLSALQISTSGICLYIDWSNRQRYTHLKSHYLTDLPSDDNNDNIFPGEDNNDDDNGNQDKIWNSMDNYIKFWDYYDKKFYKPALASSKKTITPHSPSNLTVSPHYCNDIEGSGEIAKAVEIIEGDYYDDWDYDPSPLYHAGKSFTDQFFTCSISDGTVGVVDVIPKLNDGASPEFGMRLTHHWLAHKAECWVSVCDGFDPNLIYTGADDSLLKLWDLRMIPSVNQHMDYLELVPEEVLNEGRVDKDFANTSINTTTCLKCQRDGLSLGLPQYSQYHGVGFDISQCTMYRGLQTVCTAATGCYCNAHVETAANEQQQQQQQPQTMQYKFNIDKLAQDHKFNPDFTPIDSAYPILTNTQHEAGVIEIKPHPYNPFLLLTGSYDNHVSLYDKRNLKVPINRVDTGGGAWRIKWHSNPRHSDQFLLVNMYNGVQYGSVKGMGLSLSDRDESGSIFQPLQTPTSPNAKCDISSHYPSTLYSKVGDAGLAQSSASFTNVYQHAVRDRMQSNDITRVHTEPTPPMATNLTQVEFVGIVNQIHGIGSDSSINDSTSALSSFQVALDESAVQGYHQHGPKSIVYGGDWCQLNDISDRTEPVTNNVAVTCSFYNKRTDLLTIGSKPHSPSV